MNVRHDAPRVSILMPVYNAGAYLDEAIESATRQTYDSWELLAADDGSTDDSLSRLEAWAAREPRIRILACEHRGLTPTLNAGLAEVRGEFVARLDADDLAEPERLALQVAYLDEHPDCVAVSGQVLLIDAEGDPIGPLGAPCDHANIERELLSGRGTAITHGAALFRTAALAAVGGYRDEYCGAEDLDLFLRLAERGELANLPQVVLQYRKHPASATALARQEKNLAMKRKIVAEALSRRGRGEPPQLRTFAAPGSAADIYAQWIVQATNAGYDRTATKYLARLCRAEPWRLRTWQTVAGVALRRCRRAFRPAATATAAPHVWETHASRSSSDG